MRKSYKMSIGIISLIIITSGVGAYFTLPKIYKHFQLKEIESQNKEAIEEVQQKTSTYLQVPFICQAPLQTEENWVYHEESCEEAAVLQAYLYETDQSVTKEEANEIILDMIDWQIKHFDGHHDIYADKVKEFIHGYYEIPNEDIEIIYNADLDIIKKYISEGHPVIVPITGNILKNPYYPHPGYHMLVVRGYTKDRIITNDNGTRRGEDFSYDNEVFIEAMNDAGGDIVVINAKTTTFSH